MVNTSRIVTLSIHKQQSVVRTTVLDIEWQKGSI